MALQRRYSLPNYTAKGFLMKTLLALLLLVPCGLAQTPVQLTWTASTTPNTVVRVYRGNACTGPWIVVAQNVPAAGPWSTVIPSAPGTSVSFQITAVDAKNQESAPSNCATVTIPTVPPPTPPAAPTALTVTIPTGGGAP